MNQFSRGHALVALNQWSAIPVEQGCISVLLCQSGRTCRKKTVIPSAFHCNGVRITHSTRSTTSHPQHYRPVTLNWNLMKRGRRPGTRTAGGSSGGFASQNWADEAPRQAPPGLSPADASRGHVYSTLLNASKGSLIFSFPFAYER
jgi:hypothetical protein